jgi:hypothetical protein
MVLKVGENVRISGLQSRPELNGTFGTIVSVKGERWVVELAGDTSTRLALKATSLAELDPVPEVIDARAFKEAAAAAIEPAGGNSTSTAKVTARPPRPRPAAMCARPGKWKLDYDWREVHPTNQPLPKGLEYMISLEEAVPTIARIPPRWKLDVFSEISGSSPYRMEVGGSTTVGEIQTALRSHQNVAEGELLGRPSLSCNQVQICDPTVTVASAKLFGFKVTCTW